MISSAVVPRILVIGYCYPPTVSPEGVVTAKLLRNLPNCKIDIVTLDDGLISPRLDNGMGRYASEIDGNVYRVSIGCILQKLLGIRRLPLRPDRWLLLNRAVTAKAEQLVGANSYNCLITRSQYHSAHLVGAKLKRRFSGLPWIACFSDPWSNADHQQRIPIISQWSDRQERRVLELADRLVFPTKGMQDHFTKGRLRFERKSYVVPHSFDLRLYGQVTPEKVQSRTQVVVRLFGSFYGARTPDVLFDALHRIRIPDDLHFMFEVFGPWHQAYAKLHATFPESGKILVKYKGQVDHIVALSKMQEADLLVIVDAPGPGKSFYLPSKIVDYLGSGSPILSLCRDGVVKEMTQKAGGIIADPADVHSVVAAFEHWIEHRKKISYHAEKSVFIENDAGSIGYRFRSLIEELM
jgi:glycosyltransferase involved in cell wall biosynthesis